MNRTTECAAEAALGLRPENAGTGSPRRLVALLGRLSGAGATRLGRGRVLAAQGDAPSFGYVLLEGLAIETTLLSDGRRHILDLLGPGAFCGVEAGPRLERSVEAITALALFRFPLGGFRRLLVEDRDVAEALAVERAGRLARAQRKLVALGCLNAEQRVAQFLLWAVERAARLGEAPGPDGAAPMPLGRAEIGEYLGLSAETVCRALSRLRALGLLEMPGAHRFAAPDPAALAAFVADDPVAQARAKAPAGGPAAQSPSVSAAKPAQGSSRGAGAVNQR